MTSDNSVAYLKILKPKAKRWGKGNIQHISVHEIEFILFLDSVIFGNVPKEEKLYACSPSAFRRRWDAVLDALKIPKRSNLTPGYPWWFTRRRLCSRFSPGLRFARVVVEDENKTPSDIGIFSARGSCFDRYK